MTDHDTPVAVRGRRNRLALLGLLAVFLLPILAAAIINFSGRRPAPTRQHGQLLQPPLDLGALKPRLVDGSVYAWEPAARTWRIVVAPPAGCARECTKLAHDLDVVWRLFGRNADRVHVLWLCAARDCKPPRDALSPATLRVLSANPVLHDSLPGVDDASGVPVYVIDPNGFLVLRYAPDFDPAGLRADMARLLKLM